MWGKTELVGGVGNGVVYGKGSKAAVVELVGGTGSLDVVA